MNFRQYDDSTLNLHREEFEYLFEAPFKVDEFYLDDLNGAEIFDLYKEKLCRCYTIPEMMNVAKEFGFLTWGAVAALNRLSNYWVEPIKNIIKKGTEAKIKEYEMPLLAHILMPINILWGGLISDKYGLPLYYASLQYVRVSVYGEGKEKNNDLL